MATKPPHPCGHRRSSSAARPERPHQVSPTLLCGVVWCDVVRCGAVRCSAWWVGGVVWCGV
eukprot:11977471-Prorocentrum_lima.AAC.1